jgi:PKHD-type hydroxylase
MHIVLEGVLPPDQLSRVKQIILNDRFIDGNATSTLQGKNNLQLPADSEACKEAGAIVTECLNAHDSFVLAVQPQVILPPLFNRYDVGMEYPDHIDQAIIRRHRTDISITVFLNEPDTYQGGALVVDSGNGERRYRLNAGDAIVYPSSTIHRVAKVTQGTRLAAVLWVQSWVRDPAKRQILYDIGATVQYMTLVEGPYSERLRQSYCNLTRLWANA